MHNMIETNNREHFRAGFRFIYKNLHLIFSNRNPYGIKLNLDRCAINLFNLKIILLNSFRILWQNFFKILLSSMIDKKVWDPTLFAKILFFYSLFIIQFVRRSWQKRQSYKAHRVFTSHIVDSSDSYSDIGFEFSFNTLNQWRHCW